MRRMPGNVLFCLFVAGVALVIAIWLGIAPAPKPSWASNPNAGRELRMIFCATPLVLFALANLIAVARILMRRAR